MADRPPRLRRIPRGEMNEQMKAKMREYGWPDPEVTLNYGDGLVSFWGDGTRYTHAVAWSFGTDARVVYGDIFLNWYNTGHVRGPLRYPLTDEKDFSEGGRISTFQGGSFYWWPDTGSMLLNDVVVHYTGLNCFGETDWDGGSNSDEPYVVVGVTSGQGAAAHISRIYDDVDAGESMPDLMEIYRGKPTGLVLSVLLMEHDAGDPNAYGRSVRGAAEDIFNHLPRLEDGAILIVAVPGALYASGVLFDLTGRITGAGDDVIGSAAISLSAKQMVMLAARTPNSTEWSVGFKVATPLLTGEGASYKAYFGVVPG